MPKAFDFRLVGEEAVNGRPAYVLQATPHPGYQAQGKDGKMFSKVEGKLWVDKQDLGWIKVDGQVIEPFSIGLFLARVLRGSEIKITKLFTKKIVAAARTSTRSGYQILPSTRACSIGS